MLPVRTVTDREPLLPGVVYVVPTDRNAEISGHEVRLRANHAQRPKSLVDRPLTSADRAYGERRIAMILTCSDSDGAAGARAVKATGGMVIIETSATVAFPGICKSLPPTTVDLVVDLERSGPLLHDLLDGVKVTALQ